MPATLAGPSPTVTGGIDPNLLARAIAPALERALDELGAAESAAIQQEISVPVVVTIGPQGGERVERSKPGEPPRMDHLVLVRNIGHEVEPGEDGLPELVITAHRPPEDAGDQPDAAVILEYGGVNQQGRTVAPRPFMTPALERLKRYAGAFVANLMHV